MTSMPSRVLLTVLCVAAVYVAAVEYLALRSLPQRAGPADFDGVARLAPWGGYGWREAADDAGRYAMASGAERDRVLAAAAARYPLDAGLWLDRARLAMARGGDLAGHLDAAVAVDPRDLDVLWESAMLAVRAGDFPLAERLLRQWAEAAQPRQSARALFVASRWLDDPEALIERVLPEGPDYRTEAMAYARQRGDLALGEAVWARAAGPVGPEDGLLHAYTDLLLRKGRARRAAGVWAAADPAYRPFGVPNGDFARALGGNGGLNWYTRVSETVRVARDTETYRGEVGSLRVTFDGTENVHLHAPYVRLPVQGGETYRISGSWKGEGLTTRSLPYLQVYAESGNGSETVEVPAADFDWQSWELTIDVPEDTSVLRLRLRRDATKAFDRYIEGTLWIDGIGMDSGVKS